MAHDHTFMIEFISLYQSLPCLWKKDDPQYYKTSERDAAYKVLLKQFRGYDSKATKRTVTSKINNLRSAYNKEYKKVKQSEASGAGQNEIYRPSLWYFDLMSFLHDQISFRSLSTSNRNEYDDLGDRNSLAGSVELLEQVSAHSTASSTPLSNTPCITINEAQKRRKSRTTANKKALQLLTRNQNNQKEGRNEAFGKHVAEELDNMEPSMVPFAKRLISEALFEGYMRTLNRTSTIRTHQLHSSNSVLSEEEFQVQSGTKTNTDN